MTACSPSSAARRAPLDLTIGDVGSAVWAPGGLTVSSALVRTNGLTTTLLAARGDLQVGTWYHAAATYDIRILQRPLGPDEVVGIVSARS